MGLLLSERTTVERSLRKAGGIAQIDSKCWSGEIMPSLAKVKKADSESPEPRDK
jgi:hypothetical protein